MLEASQTIELLQPRFVVDAAIQQVPRRASLVAQTVTIIRDEIRAGRWRKWMPGEHELCGLLHVSRRTLRAALKQLQREGLLRATQGQRREIVSKRKGRSKGSIR